jgi:predicted RNA-binding Zn-ribbon protein involved in translation (DUF1610 family)
MDKEKKMPNDNCLADMKCPDCGSDGPFTIFATCWASVTDGGVEQADTYDWDSASQIICPRCGGNNNPRIVRDFYTKK